MAAAGARVDRLLCVYGRPRTGTTSIAGELNSSPDFCIWIEKDLWVERSYLDKASLAASARMPGGTSGMARRYNEEVLSPKEGYRVLGDKTTWMSSGPRDGIEIVRDNLLATARALEVPCEIVACVREPCAWLAAWAMTHYLRTAGPDESFWAGLVDDPDVRALLEQEKDRYASHLEIVLDLGRDPSVRIRCLERTTRDDFHYLFEFDEYLKRIAPAVFRKDPWPGLLRSVKQRLEERIRSGWTDARRADAAYASLLDSHRPCDIPAGDGTVRHV